MEIKVRGNAKALVQERIVEVRVVASADLREAIPCLVTIVREGEARTTSYHPMVLTQEVTRRKEE